MCILSVLKTSPSFLDWLFLKWIYIVNFVKRISFSKVSCFVAGHNEATCKGYENFFVSQEDNSSKDYFAFTSVFGGFVFPFPLLWPISSAHFFFLRAQKSFTKALSE